MKEALGISLVIDKVRWGAVTETGKWEEWKGGTDPRFEYHYGIGAGSVLGKGDGDPPCDDCLYSGGTLPTITVSAQRIGSNYDRSYVRYGFKGTFEQWQ